MADEVMIQAEGLEKRYGDTQALAGVDFSVPAGTILGPARSQRGRARRRRCGS